MNKSRTEKQIIFGVAKDTRMEYNVSTYQIKNKPTEAADARSYMAYALRNKYSISIQKIAEYLNATTSDVKALIGRYMRFNSELVSESDRSVIHVEVKKIDPIEVESVDYFSKIESKIKDIEKGINNLTDERNKLLLVLDTLNSLNK